jgi:hypothetical protein
MNRLTPSIVIAAGAVVAASCAPVSDSVAPGTAAAGLERQCFISSQVRNFRSKGATQLYVRANDNSVFELNTSAGCFDLDAATSLTIVPDGAALAGSRVCTGDWARLTVLPAARPGGGVCRARVERVLTPEQVAALPSRLRP